MLKIKKVLIVLIIMLISINIIYGKKLNDRDRVKIEKLLNEINGENSDFNGIEKREKGVKGENIKKQGIVKSGKEMRGVWVATTLNIDWPSKKALLEEEQRKEFIKILDNVKEWNMNAVFVQIKPVGDAFYPSKYSPWSEYLTGEQGKAPNYDPLKFMIDEAHKRGIEFHGWFNPYRLTMSGGMEKLSVDNIGKKRPEWTIFYGNKLYLNPGIPEVNNYVIESIMEVVKNYEIDGVHMDDYFYPYKVKNQVYMDDLEYKKYGVGFKNKDDWRRNNINELIKKLSNRIKNEKENVVFGISPFGVWRNVGTDPIRGSKTRAGIQNYDDLYADILYWIEREWIDYVVPQIYWHQGFEIAEYNTLVKWWSDNTRKTKTKLYIGQGAYRVKEWKKEDELINQLNYNKNFDEVSGSVFFSYKSLFDNPKNILEKLEKGPYKEEVK